MTSEKEKFLVDYVICIKNVQRTFFYLVNKTNRCTEYQFYWCYYSTCFGRLSAHHQEFLALHRLWYILCSCDEPFATTSRSGLPETRRIVITIKIGIQCKFGFIQKVFADRLLFLSSLSFTHHCRKVGRKSLNN